MLPTHSQIISGFGKLPEEEEEITRLPTHEQIVSTQKVKVPEVEEEPTGLFDKLKSFVQKFIPEAVKTAKVTDESLKARFKGTYALLSNQAADVYRGEGVVGKLMSIPTLTFLMPKSYREKTAGKLSEQAKKLQDSAVEDMKVVEDFIKENPLEVDMQGVAFGEKIKDPKWVARGLTLNAPSLLASMGISTVVAITTKNPVLAYTSAFGTSFSMEAGDAYNDAIKAGESEKEARTIGTIVGGINGILDSLFPGSKATDLMGSKQIKKQFFKRLTTVVIDVVKEGSTESLQEIISNVGRSVYEENVDLLEGTKEAAFFGVLMGGVTSVSTETYQQLKSAGIEVNEEVVKTEDKEVKPAEKPVEVVKPISKELEPLAQEAKKYKSVEEFRNALFPSGGALDISNRGTQRFGRLISSSIKGEELPTIRQFAKDLDFEWKDLFKQYKETPPDLSEGKITIWRAAPKGTKIEAGDWVALTKKYAEGHLGQFGRNKLYKMEVSIDDVVNAGTDASEWFYAPKELRKQFGELYSESQLTDFYNQVMKKEITQKEVTKPKKEVKIAREIVQLQEKVIEKKIKTTKDIKGVRDTVKSISQELNTAVTEAEGRSIVAQEQRAGLNVEDINQLKRVYAINKKFQEGDIETIRASKSGPLLNRVLENIQEKHPEFSEQEAFDFAIGLPTKADEKARTSEIVQLEKKEKKLREYLTQLRDKQKELKIEESELLTKEWESVLAAQERLTQLIRVPETRLPVGEGAERVSRLEARVKDALGKITPEEQKDLSTYRQMNKAEQIAKASKYVAENTDEALKVLKGEIDPPTGILRNSIYVAMKELGSADTQLATQLASLASTRMGQEISILSELDIYSPVSLMEDVIKARIEGYKRKGKSLKESVKRESGKIEVDKPSGSDWDSFLQTIRC